MKAEQCTRDCCQERNLCGEQPRTATSRRPVEHNLPKREEALASGGPSNRHVIATSKGLTWHIAPQTPELCAKAP